MGAVAEKYGLISFSTGLEKLGIAPVAFNVPTPQEIDLASTSIVPGVLAPEVRDLRMPSQGIQPPRRIADPDGENAPRDTNGFSMRGLAGPPAPT